MAPPSISVTLVIICVSLSISEAFLAFTSDDYHHSTSSSSSFATTAAHSTSRLWRLFRSVYDTGENDESYDHDQSSDHVDRFGRWRRSSSSVTDGDVAASSSASSSTSDHVSSSEASSSGASSPEALAAVANFVPAVETTVSPEAATAAAVANFVPAVETPSKGNQTPKTKATSSFADKAKNLKGGNWLDNARKKKNCVTIIGKEKSSTIVGVAPLVRDYWDLSVSRLNPSSTPDGIKHYLQERQIEVKEVFVFGSKIPGTKSAKVRVAVEHREKAKKEEIWPEFVRVQDWVYKSKSSKNATQKS